MPVKFSGKTAQEIIDALADAYPNVDNLRQMVLFVLETQLNTFADESNALPFVIFQLCTQAQATGRLDDLLRGAAKHNPGNELLGALNSRLFGEPIAPAGTAPGPAGVEAFHDRCVLGDDLVFVDRASLRAAVKNIHEWSVKRLVVVTGQRKSGKSYSAELIRFGARKLGYETITINLSSLPRDNPVKALAEAIVGPMQPQALVTGLPGQGKESSARWLHHPLMRTVEAWMRQTKGTWWLLFDEFDRDVLAPDIYEFITDLGVKIENDLPNFRLALLGYDQAIPAPWTDRARHEEIRHLERQHLVEFFRRLYEENRVAPDDVTIDSVVEPLYLEFTNRRQQFESNVETSLLNEDATIIPMSFLNRQLKIFLKGFKAGAAR